MRSKSGLNLIKHNETMLDFQVLDSNLRRNLLFNRPFRFLFDSQGWHAYTHFDHVDCDLKKALRKSYLNALLEVGNKAKKYCYSQDLKKQLKLWLEKRMDTKSKSTVKALLVRPADLEMEDLDLGTCKKYSVATNKLEKMPIEKKGGKSKCKE